MKTTIRKTAVYLFIEQALFDRVEKLVTAYNKQQVVSNAKLKMDFMVYVLDLITKYKARDKKEYVHLNAKLLEKIRKDYNHHMNFLVLEGVLSRKRYSKKKGKSYSYKVNYVESKNSVQRAVKVYDPLNFNFRKKLFATTNKRKDVADKKTRHLTKWLNGGYVTIDYDAALTYINTSEMLSDEQKISRRYQLEALKMGQWFYSRDGKDNRLHSNLTSLPKDLKPYLLHNGNKLISLDLKSSQPFMLAGILNLIINKEFDMLENLISGIVFKSRLDKMNGVLSVMIPKMLEPIAIIEIREFVSLIVNSDVYEYIGSHFSHKFLAELKKGGTISDLFYNDDKGVKVKKRFETIRDYSKRVFLEYLYCSPKSSEKRYKEVRAMFPDCINEFVDFLKERNTKHKWAKGDFAIILQNIESRLFLDVISKEFAKQYPNEFIATVHDSFLITQHSSQRIQNIAERQIKNRLGIKPVLKMEYEHLKSAC